MIESLHRYIDHTLLRPGSSSLDIQKLCDEALRYQFASVCIHPIWVPFVKERYPNLCIGSVVGFPLGSSTTYIKTKEAEELITFGVSEIDMVIDISALKEGRHSHVVSDIASVVSVCSGEVVKVILETSLLTDVEKKIGAELCVEAGAAFVKTSTGFSHAGATVHDVTLLYQAVNGAIHVKASGGIKDRKTAEALIMAGATRLGTSSGVSIMESLSSNEIY
jgi:deoxyribose-phosphate aldolase